MVVAVRRGLIACSVHEGEHEATTAFVPGHDSVVKLLWPPQLRTPPQAAGNPRSWAFAYQMWSQHSRRNSDSRRCTCGRPWAPRYGCKGYQLALVAFAHACDATEVKWVLPTANPS